MENQWYKHITRNNFSRYIAAEKQRWIETHDYFMRSMFLKQMGHPNYLPQNVCMNLMAAHCLKQISSCMVFPPAKVPPLYHCPHPFQFPSSRGALTSGMLPDRYKHRPISNQYLRSEQPIRERDWRRETNDGRSQIYPKRFEVNLPSSSSFQRSTKDSLSDRSAERTKGRKLRPTTWSPKGTQTTQSTNDSAKEQSHDKDIYNRFYRVNKHTKRRSHNYEIHDECDLDIAGHQCSDPSFHSEEPDSQAHLLKNRCASIFSENTIHRKRSDRSSQSSNNNSPSTVAKEPSKSGRKKIHGTSWAAQVEQENAFVENPVVSTTEAWNWFCKDEQQRIVNTLKNEDLAHQQQLMQSFLFRNSNGNGDSLNLPTISNIGFCYEDFPDAQEDLSSSSYSEDGITVIIPTDAFSKSLELFKNMQPDSNAIAATSVDFSESSTIGTQAFFHERQLLIENPNETLNLVDHEEWGKYCVGWCAHQNQKDQLPKTHDQQDSICNLLSSLNFGETVPIHLPEDVNVKEESGIRNVPLDLSENDMLNSEVHAPEFHPLSYAAEIFEQNTNTEMSKLAITDVKDSDSFAPHFEDGNAFIRAFGLNNGYDCYKSPCILQVHSPETFNNSFVNTIANNNDLTTDEYPREHILRINNYCCDFDQNHHILKSKPCCDSQDAFSDMVVPRKRYRPYSPPVVNHHYPSRLSDANVDEKECPTHTESYQNSCLFSSTTANKVIDEEGSSTSINDKHNIKASNYLKFILGIPTNMDNNENEKYVIDNSAIKNAKHRSSGVFDNQSFVPIASSLSKHAEPSIKSSVHINCTSFHSNSSSPTIESELISKHPLSFDYSSEWECLSYSTSVNDSIPKNPSKYPKHESSTVKDETDSNFKSSSLKLRCNFGEKRDMQDMNCENENKVFLREPSSNLRSQSDKCPGSSSQRKTKISKPKKERKCELKQEEEFKSNRCSVVVTSAGVNNISKKICNTENTARTCNNPSQNQHIYKSNLELKTFKDSKLTPNKITQKIPCPDGRLLKNTKNTNRKPINKSNFSEKRQHDNKCKISDHHITTKLIKTNAEIAAEYQSRRKAKLYHEKNLNTMEPENSKHCTVTQSFSRLIDTKPSMRGKTKAFSKEKASLNDIENVANKLDRRKHHERIAFRSTFTGRTRVKENEFKNMNIVYNGSPNIANLHETMTVCLPSTSKESCGQETCTVKSKDQTKTEQQRRNFDKQINNNKLNTDEREFYASFSEILDLESATTCHETQQCFSSTFISSFHYPQNLILPWTVENSSNPLSNKLKHDLLRVSHFVHQSMTNCNQSLFPNTPLEQLLGRSNQVNILQSIDFRSVASRGGGGGLDTMFCDFSLNFPIKFYNYLYHSWRRYHPLKTTFICRHGLNKRLTFASWVRRGFYIKDYEPNEK